jgi:hypothetical protein
VEGASAAWHNLTTKEIEEGEKTAEKNKHSQKKKVHTPKVDSDSSDEGDDAPFELDNEYNYSTASGDEQEFDISNGEAIIELDL